MDKTKQRNTPLFKGYTGIWKDRYITEKSIRKTAWK